MIAGDDPKFAGHAKHDFYGRRERIDGWQLSHDSNQPVEKDLQMLKDLGLIPIGISMVFGSTRWGSVRSRMHVKTFRCAGISFGRAE